MEGAKAHIRAKVEHPFRVNKQQFGFHKFELRGLEKISVRSIFLLRLAPAHEAQSTHFASLKWHCCVHQALIRLSKKASVGVNQ